MYPLAKARHFVGHSNRLVGLEVSLVFKRSGIYLSEFAKRWPLDFRLSTGAARFQASVTAQNWVYDPCKTAQLTS